MSEQTLKEIGIELKKLELKEDDVLVAEVDLIKCKPDELIIFTEIISNLINSEIIFIPKEMNLKTYKIDDILKIRDKFNKEIDKILKGENNEIL